MQPFPVFCVLLYERQKPDDRKEREKLMRRKGMERVTAGVLAAVMAVGMTGCANSGMSGTTADLTGQYGTKEEGQTEGTGANGQTGQAEDTGTEDTAMEEKDLGAIREAFEYSYTQFSLNLLRESRKQVQNGEDAKNTMVCPLSVMMALEMARTGADGDTKQQMGAVLYPGMSAEDGSMVLGRICKSLPDAEGARFHMSDSVWVKTADDAFVPDENFLDTVKTAYDAEVFGAPFDETTCRDINRLVEQETDGMITEILDQIPELAVMYLVNAVAFDAEWETPYDESQIQDATFYAEDGSGQEVSMMYDTTYRYLTMEHAKGFCRAYKEDYDFVALLPEEGLSLSKWLEELDGETFHETIRQENDTMIETGLPQFTGETDLELKDTLTALGMPLAFDEEQADFSKMGYCPDGRNISISRVLHKTHIDVDGLGTKAGAATVVEMCKETAMVEQPERIILDRPFLYAIVEKDTGIPVFIGTVESF